MDGSKALAEVKRLAARNCIVFTFHATQRMAERGATADDVRGALISATLATWQADRSNWKISGGQDLEGDDLTCIVDIQADVVVVTIY